MKCILLILVLTLSTNALSIEHMLHRNAHIIAIQDTIIRIVIDTDRRKMSDSERKQIQHLCARLERLGNDFCTSQPSVRKRLHSL